MLRVLIIDDEAHMRDTLVKLLGVHCPEVQVVGQASGVTSGTAAINEFHPDLVFLDIQMNDGTGFDLFYNLPSIDFKVIFVTAYDKYALQAFRCSAVDYLLKPVNPELLTDAVNRAGQMIQEHFNLQMKALEENLKSVNKQHKKIIIKTTENIHLLEMKNIISCESESSYTTIHTTGGDKILVSKTLKDYEDMLADCGFYRVHKSFLINLLQIKRFERQDGGSIVMSNDLKIPVASRKRDELLLLFEKLAE
jgi:two-component system LytT family response regulator